MKLTSVFERRDPKTLRNHLANIKIYGGREPSAEFLESCKDGIHTPLLILPDGTVISGMSRRFAAMQWKLKEVPVIVRYDLEDDPLMAELVLIQCNTQREKTNEQIANEARRLKEIFSEFADRRMKAGQPSSQMRLGSETSENLEKGRTDDKVADTLGISRRAARDAAEVGEAIAEAEQAGDTETAEEIKEVVNKKGFSAAKKAARKKKEEPEQPEKDDDDAEVLDELGKPVPENLREIFEQIPEWESAKRAVSDVKSAVKGLCEHKASGYLDRQEVERLIEQTRTLIKFAAPHTECPKCRRKLDKKCEQCKGSGWLTKARLSACASDADMAWLEGSRK